MFTFSTLTLILQNLRVSIGGSRGGGHFRHMPPPPLFGQMGACPNRKMNRHGECVQEMDEKVCLVMIWTGNACKMGGKCHEVQKKKKVFLEKHYF